MRWDSPIQPDEVESLVRSYLEAAPSDFDLEKHTEEIERRLADLLPDRAAKEPAIALRKRPSPIRRILGWSSALAASIALAVVSIGYLVVTPAPANAYSLVSEADQVLAKSADRCYRVEFDVPKAWMKRYPFFDKEGETRLWTRGDRFRVTTSTSGRDYIWGEDPMHRVWVLAEPDLGLQFERGEIPPALVNLKNYFGLNVRRLAREFLNDYDLSIERNKNPSERNLVTVLATPRHRRPSSLITSARLELDAKTKVIRRMELTREANGTVQGRFTFTLLVDSQLPDESYELQGNLTPDGRIMGRAEKAERMKALRQMMQGAAAGSR